MTTCPRCQGEKTLPTLSLVGGKRWIPIAYDACPDCNGTGLQPERICKFCGMYLHDANNGPYCNDDCHSKSLRPITLDNKRFKIKAVVEAPTGGWTFGENVTLEKNGYIVEVRIGVGGAVLSRTRRKGTSIEGGVITVEKIK